MRGTVKLAGSIDIERPVDEVFDFVSDQTNEPLYNAKMLLSTKKTDGPIDRGTTFHAITGSWRRPHDMDIEVTELRAPCSFRTTTHMAMMDVDGGLTFTPVPTGTRMAWNWDVHPNGAWRWLRPVVKVVGQRNERAIWTTCKAQLEATVRDGTDHLAEHGTRP